MNILINARYFERYIAQLTPAPLFAKRGETPNTRGGVSQINAPNKFVQFLHYFDQLGIQPDVHYTY